MAEPSRAEPSRLHRSYRTRLERLRATTATVVIGLDADDVATFVAAVVPVVLDAQRATVAATDAYMSLEAGIATGTSPAPLGIDAERIIGQAARRGVLLEDVYARNWRTDASSFTERMTREVNTDISLAQRSTAWLHTEGDPRVIGWQRITSGNPCPLCSAAAGQRYKRSDLQPIHAHCSCSVAAVYGEGRRPSPAQIIALYPRLESATVARRTIPATSTTPAVAITDTPELGPSLIAA